MEGDGVFDRNGPQLEIQVKSTMGEVSDRNAPQLVI
jgi:hypothetical protein